MGNPKITIVWGTSTVGSSELLKDAEGNPLSAGVRGNGDGDLVELGYFSSGSTSDPFAGDWIPLTRGTHVGDSSSGYGFNDGMFIFTTTFEKNRDFVIVFPTEPKEFEENLGFTITSSTPAPGTPVCIRFYDKPSSGGANYNTVTGTDWLWPSFPDGSSIPSNRYFKISNSTSSSWSTGAIFEDPTNPFKTSLSPTYFVGIKNSEYSSGSGTFSDINGSYAWGTEISITATPGPHTYFYQWWGTGISERWNETTTLTVDGAQTIYAEFAQEPYVLHLETNENGEVSGNGIYYFGDSVPIYAFPNYGYSFSHWEKNGSHYSSNANETVSIEGDLDLRAIFTRNTYEVLIGADFGGSYEILDSNGSAPETILHGEQYTLRSMPEKHFGFNSWSTTSEGESMIGNKYFAETSFIPTGDINITVSFFELNYQLNIESTQGYSSLSSSGSFPALISVPVEVEVLDGFVFDYWQDPFQILANPNDAQTEANISKIYPYQSATVSAILRLDVYEEQDINITAGSGGNILFESDDSGGFSHFTTYELNATANLGYQFDYWEGDTGQLEFGAYEKNNKFLVEGPLSLRAVFRLSNYDLNLVPIGEGTVIGPETFTLADNPSVKAVPFTGYRFTHWTGDTAYLLDNLASETFIQWENNTIPEDLTLEANFVPEEYQISLNSEGNGSIDLFFAKADDTYENHYGIVSKTLAVNSETQITLESYPQEGWSFSYWSGLPDISELSNPISHLEQYDRLVWFYPASDLNLTANFNIIEYDDSQIVVNSGLGGDLFLDSELTGNFKHFSSYDINASAKRGYEFSGWLMDAENSSLLYGTENPDNRINILGEVEINATFSLIEYSILVTNVSGGTTEAPSTYTVLDNPLLNAQESPGWDFSHWSGDIEYLTDPNASQSIVNHASLPLKDLNFSPNFIRESYSISVTSSGAGSFDISKDETGLISGSTGEVVSIDSATRLGVQAIPDSGWKFSQWFGLPDPDGLRDNAPSLNPLSTEIHFVPAADVNISAQFERENYTLNIVQPDIGGGATGAGSFLFEAIVDLNASPQEHYKFYTWSGDIDNLVYDSGAANNKLEMPASNVSIEPIFRPSLYSINTLSDENGSFEISGTYNDITKVNLPEYNATSSITVSALPLNSDSHMLNYLYWENTLGESGFSYSSTFSIPFLDGNYSFWAYFIDRNDIGYSLFTSPPYAGSAGQNSAYSSAQIQRLVATPSPGYSFIGWESKTGESFSPNWRLHQVDSSLQDSSEIWAHFAQQSRFLTLEFDQSQGSINGFSEKVDYGHNLVVTATPDENYTFVDWELVKAISFEVSRKDSTIYPTEQKLFINGEETPELSLIRGFTYHFDSNLSDGDEFFLSTSADADSGESNYLSGVTVDSAGNGRLTFEVPTDAPNTLYYHGSGSNYSGNLIKISSVDDSSLLPTPTNPIFSNRVTHHFGLRANFERTRHSLSISSSGQGSVNFTEQDIYYWGDEIEISATPLDHWFFSHWEGSSKIASPLSMETTVEIVKDSTIQAVFKPVQYQVDVNASPSEYGLVTQPTETYTYGDYIDLTALPQTGKQFDGWSSLENLSLDNPDDQFEKTASFKVLGNAKAEAIFSRIVMDVEIQLLSLDQNNQPIIGDIGATVSRPEIIYHGDSVTFTLSPNTGYTFLYWVDLISGEIITTQKSFTSTIISDRSFQAVLRKNYYYLESSSIEGGVTEIIATYPHYWGDEITVLATPDEHWVFSRWSGRGSEHLDDPFSASTVLTIQQDTALFAEFKPKGYSLDIAISPTGYGGHSSIESSYNFGDTIEIEATPRSGKVFHSWSIDYNASIASNYTTQSNPANFVISGHAQLTAKFESKQYNVSPKVVVFDEFDSVRDGVYGGRILGIGDDPFYDEDTAEFAISLANGYKLKHWRNEVTGEILSSERVYKHKMLSDLNLTAVVTERKYEVDLKISPSVGGEALLNDYFISESYYRDNFSYGEQINLSASASDGYRFVKWSATGTTLGSPTQANQTFSLGNDIKLTAYFAPEGLVNLSLVSEPAEAASYLFGEGSFEYNPDHAILAMPKEGYLFSHWDFNGSKAVGIVKDASSSTTSVALDGDKLLTAVFIIDENAPPTNEESNKLYLLSVYSDNTRQGTTSGSGFFRGVRTIKAYPKDGFEFSHWEGATFVNQYDEITQVSIFENTNVIAHFQSVGVFEDSESLDNGWWGNPWFGYFWKVGDDDWLFHEKLGWIFMKKKGDQSIWVWIQKMDDWYWTAKEHYPYLHSSTQQSWYFVNLEKSNYTRLVIFDYSSSEWLIK